MNLKIKCVVIRVIFLFFMMVSLHSQGGSLYYNGGVIYPGEKVDGIGLERVGINFIDDYPNVELYYRLRNTTSADIAIDIMFPFFEKYSVHPDGRIIPASEYQHDSIKILYTGGLFLRAGYVSADFFKKSLDSLKRTRKITEDDDVDEIFEYGYAGMDISFLIDETYEGFEYIILESNAVKSGKIIDILVTYNLCYKIIIKKQKASIINISLGIAAAPVDYMELRFRTGAGKKWNKPIPKIGCFSRYPIDEVPWKSGTEGQIQARYYSVQDNYTPGLMDELIITQDVYFGPQPPDDYYEEEYEDDAYSEDDGGDVDEPEEMEITILPEILDDVFMMDRMKELGIDMDRVKIKKKE